MTRNWGANYEGREKRKRAQALRIAKANRRSGLHQEQFLNATDSE